MLALFDEDTSMSVYLVELPLTVRLYQDDTTPETQGSVKFVVDAEDSQEACNKVACLIAQALEDGLEGEDEDSPVVLS